MTKPLLLERELLCNPDGQGRLRLLRRSGKQFWVYALDDESALPYLMSAAVLEDLADSGQLVRCTSTATPASSPTPMMRKRARDRYQRLRAILESDEQFTPNGRMRVFAQLTAQDRVSYQTMMRCLRAWWAGGMVVEALNARWDVSTRATKVNFLEDFPSIAEIQTYCREKALRIDMSRQRVTRGRPSKRAGSTLYDVDPMTVLLFKHYFSPKLKRKSTLVQAYWDMVGEVFSIVDVQGRATSLDDLRRPSEAQFRNWYAKLFTAEERRRAQIGSIEFDKNECAISGNETSASSCAGDIASLDATIWNVDVRSRLPGRRIIGPPVVFRVRDNRSGMLLGLSVSLENASWMSAASAVANCLEDKVAFCARYGVHITPEQWPVRGLFSKGFADRGETDNYGPEHFIEKTGVSIVNLKPKQPHLKGGKEGNFFVLQVSMNNDTPGAAIEKWTKGNSRLFRCDTVLDLDQFIALLLEHEIEQLKRPRQGTALTPEMIRDGVDGSKLSMWNWSIRHDGCGLKDFDLETVQLALMPRETASVREDGLFFRGILYHSPSLLRSGLFSKARRQGRMSRRVAFDPRVVDQIYLVDDERDLYEVCRINLNLESQRDFVGKCFREVAELRSLDADNRAAGKEAHLSAALDRKHATRTIIAEGTRQTKAADGLTGESRSARLKGIREARKRERDAVTSKDAFTPGKQPADDASAQIIAFPSPAASPTPTQLPIDDDYDSFLDEMQPRNGS